MTQKFKLLIEYDGTSFCGWQSQKARCGVQDAFSGAFEKFCGEQVTVFGAGRTDAGVHARGQVGHVTLENPTDANMVRKAVNYHLRPLPAAILQAEEVDEDFDARFCALKRIYQYRFICRRAPLTLDVGQAWHVPYELDVEAMHEAAQAFVGQHDFSTFRSSHCESASPVKNIDDISVTSKTNSLGTELSNEITINVSARSFLHNQVRSFAGALKLVGEGKWQRADIEVALAACDRRACGVVAPPEGLTFMQVDYLAK